LSFDKHCYEHPFDFYFVSDFESILIKNQDNSTNVINTHETAGFCLHRMTSHLVFEKGHFPYAYFDSLKRLDETTLPPKSAFYNDLTESDISDRDYYHAVSVWNRFEMTAPITYSGPNAIEKFLELMFS